MGICPTYIELTFSNLLNHRAVDIFQLSQTILMFVANCTNGKKTKGKFNITHHLQ